ncbi:hypothetical protein ncot_01335 [Nocardioides sp. JQ2195]|uniref:hypothetical protein n=1 Tax=Nocardioides sp. JQ2195 TaxID=2592334 RepID=UPI00143ECC02|nr:hypothetical protein [Nocardioides sp. JQ2195]QIX25380.1 hypothetical protein ncot_01335 [Nocardioides sp. JQ2195]
MSDSEDKPVANGLIALVAVAVVVGLLAGIAILIGTKVMGVGDSSASSDETAGGASLYLPDPSETERQDGPLVTLPEAESSEQGTDEKTGKAKPDKKKSEKPKDQITLSPGASQVTPGEELYLSGVYPTGEGAVLDIEIRLEGQSWREFPVDVSVSGATFTTYVITSQVGRIQWRVVDKERNLKSNAISVTYG